MFNMLNELGYSGVKVALKSDPAPEQKQLKRLVAAKRSSPANPLEVTATESKANVAVESAVRTWQGRQFRTLRSYLGFGTGMA